MMVFANRFAIIVYLGLITRRLSSPHTSNKYVINNLNNVINKSVAAIG